MSVIDIITGLSGAIGPSGAEGSAARLAMELLSDYAPIRTDNLGSVIAELGDPNAAEHILLDAHIDEIGMIVTSVGDDGFLKVASCGGSDRRTLVGAEVCVLGRRKLPGVICSIPPHLSSGDSKAPEWSGIYIDIGYSAEQARELVPPGSRVSVKTKPYKLLGDRFTGKALDNRAGAAALIHTIELLAPDLSRLPCRLTVLLSSREEVGGQGASAAAFALEPTQAVSVDVSFAMQPGTTRDKAPGELGKGPMIGYSPILDREVTERLRELADINEIAWQNEIMGGTTGTNADDIAVSRAGVRTGLVSIPQRNMHTAAEIVDIGDIEATARLLAEFVRTGGVSHA